MEELMVVMGHLQEVLEVQEDMHHLLGVEEDTTDRHLLEDMERKPRHMEEEE
jgi:hypothetical protein